MNDFRCGDGPSDAGAAAHGQSAHGQRLGAANRRISQRWTVAWGQSGDRGERRASRSVRWTRKWEQGSPPPLPPCCPKAVWPGSDRGLPPGPSLRWSRCGSLSVFAWTPTEAGRPSGAPQDIPQDPPRIPPPNPASHPGLGGCVSCHPSEKVSTCGGRTRARISLGRAGALRHEIRDGRPG